MKDEKLRNVGIYEGKLQEKKGKRRYVGCDVTKRRRKIRASVAERRSTCALCFRKNGPKKIIQKSSVELKTSQKRRKSWRLWFFHSRRNSTKKKEKKEKEIEKSHLASIVQQGSFESMHACHIEWLILQGRIYRPISSNFCHGCVFSGYSAAYESTKNYRQTW